MLSSSAASSNASTTLLSQFKFLLRHDVISNQVLFSTLLLDFQSSSSTFQSESLKHFLNANEKLLSLAKQFKVQKDEDNLREEFNGLVLELIDVICEGFYSSTNHNDDENEKKTSVAVHDLKKLSTLFEKYSNISSFWDATEKCRWRGAGLQTPQQQQHQQQDLISSYSNASNSMGSNKLMLGVTMAVEM